MSFSSRQTPSLARIGHPSPATKQNVTKLPLFNLLPEKCKRMLPVWCC